MKLAIHNSKVGFHPLWRSYCEEKKIPIKIVNCYDTDIILQLLDCDALLWHHSQGNPKDLLIAKQILFALEHTGFKVFPNFKTNWHFDDKIGQKYLLERVEAPLVPAYVFYDKREALDWAELTTFPKVFKLRGGAGSSNVKLAKNKSDAKALIRKAFGGGFDNYNAYGSLQERYRKWRLGKTNTYDLLKGLLRFLHQPRYAKVSGKEFGYAYFQDFIPKNDSDTRVIVIGKKAFAIKRYTRKGDFRASGSGNFSAEKSQIDERCVMLAFQFAKNLELQVVGFDFVFDGQGCPLIVEISYGYVPEVYFDCEGYWSDDMNWHPGKYNHEAWMVDLLIEGFYAS